MTEIVGFFLACVAVLALSVFTRRTYGRADAVALSVCLFGSWLVTKMIAHDGNLWQTFSEHGNWVKAHSAYSTVDAVIVAIAVMFCAERTEYWKIGFVSTIVAKLGIDVLWAYAGLDTEAATQSIYGWMMNTGYGLEFVFLSVPGMAALAYNHRKSRLFYRSYRADRVHSHARATWLR